MSTALYVRVSTGEQTVENQLVALRSAGYDGEIYADEGVSGSLSSRPALDKLRYAVRVGRVTRVCSTALDRLGRSAYAVLGLLDEWRRFGITVILLREGVDTSTPMGRVILTFLAGIAELERDLIQERIGAGIARARAQGTRSGRAIGRPRAISDAQAIRAAELHAIGSSIVEIAAQLGVSEATIRRTVCQSK